MGDTLKSIRLLCEAALSSGAIRTIEDASALVTMFRDIEKDYYELYALRQKEKEVQQ